MGYESKFYVISKSSLGKDEEYNKCWANEIASFNLSCIDDYLLSNIKKYPKTDSFFYEGNEAIVEDKYGEELNEIPVKDMIALLATQMKTSDYRRYAPCLGMLLGFDEKQWGEGNLVVLHYGY